MWLHTWYIVQNWNNIKSLGCPLMSLSWFPPKLQTRRPTSWLVQPYYLSKIWVPAFQVMPNWLVFTNYYSVSFYSETLFGEMSSKQVRIFSLLSPFDLLFSFYTIKKLVRYVFLLKDVGHKKVKECMFCTCLHIVHTTVIIFTGSRWCAAHAGLYLWGA